MTLTSCIYRRFLERNTADSSSTGTSEYNMDSVLRNESPDETARRRELAFQAAQRRLQQN